MYICKIVIQHRISLKFQNLTIIHFIKEIYNFCKKTCVGLVLYVQTLLLTNKNIRGIS